MPYADACVVVGDEMVYAAYDTIVSMNLQPGGKRVLKTMEKGIGAYGRKWRTKYMTRIGRGICTKTI